MLKLAFRVLVEAAHPDLAHAATVHPVCQEELYNPGRDVSINPNENSILTPWRPVPDVRLGCASTGQSKPRAAIRMALSVRFCRFVKCGPEQPASSNLPNEPLDSQRPMRPLRCPATNSPRQTVRSTKLSPCAR